MSASELLFRGDYAALLAATIDGPTSAAAPGDEPWAIGALTFVGRTCEAEALLARHPSVPARFFVAVALAREGRDEKARVLLAQNFRVTRGAAAAARFYVCQGYAVFRYLSGRLASAALWAEAALKAATADAFGYGCALALEVLGYAQLGLGSARTGLRTLGLARARAETLGQGAVLQAIEASLPIYRARFGLVPAREAARELEAALARCRFEDSYTKAELRVELARVRLLQGETSGASALLDAANELVYHIDNPDLEINHNLCVAALLRARGELHQALALVRSVRHRARSRQDLSLLVRVAGLEERLLAALGLHAEAETLGAEVRRLTRRTRHFFGRRILARSGLEAPVATRPGEDPLGDLMDNVAARGSDAAAAVILAGWFGLLPAATGIDGSGKAILFDTEPGSMTIFAAGAVVHVPGGYSSLVRKLLVGLSRGAVSKETLALHLWGRAYNPLRHDGLIYGLVAKARRALGHHAAWIEACEIGYRLRDGVRLIEYGSPQGAPAEPVLLGARAELGVRLGSALNARQIAILQWLRAGELADPRMVIERLAVSDATASRDLGGLVTLALATRVGRGRATKYASCET